MFLAMRSALSSHTVRFDVVGVDGRADGRRTVEWIRDAFGP
jgi:Holliday junction resolvase-like predicted endonuclease